MKKLLQIVLIGVIAVVPVACIKGVHNPQSKQWCCLTKTDLVKQLPPPPMPDAKETQAELAELLRLQQSRTDKQVDSAQKDQGISVFRFSTVLGASFTKDKLPLTAAFFDSVLHIEGQIVDSVKYYWKRPRPYIADPKIHICLDLQTLSSYPSGHSCAGNLMAIILAKMVPEKKSQLLARGWRFAEYRVLGGVHYRSDIVAGKKAAQIIAKDLFKHPAFNDAYETARMELRTVLGYEM